MIGCVVDGEDYTLYPGELLLIGPYSVHGAKISSTDYSGISITFDDSVIHNTYPQSDRAILSFDRGNETERADLIALVKEAGQLEKKRSQITNLRQNAVLYKIAWLLYTRFTVGLRKPEGIKNDHFVAMRAIGYIEENHSANLTGASIAAEFGYSREYFSRIFKRLTGQSVKGFLTKTRLSDAVHRIWTSNESLSNIALNSGFPDLRSFSHAFVSEYGITPREYRHFLRTGEQPEHTRTNDAVDLKKDSSD